MTSFNFDSVASCYTFNCTCQYKLRMPRPANLELRCGESCKHDLLGHSQVLLNSVVMMPRAQIRMVLCCVLLRTVPDPECRLELELEGRAIGRQLSLSEGPSLEAPSRCDFDVHPQRKGKNHWVVGISGQTHCKLATFFECYWLDLPTSTHKSQTFLACRDL